MRKNCIPADDLQKDCGAMLSDCKERYGGCPMLPIIRHFLLPLPTDLSGFSPAEILLRIDFCLRVNYSLLCTL